MVEEEFSKWDFLKQFLLTVNYYLLIAQLIAYYRDDHQTAFLLLLILLSFERIYRIIMSMMLFSFVSGCQGVLKGILINLVFFDYSIGIDIIYDDLSFSEQQFFTNLNYISHLINYIPLSYNFWIIHQDQENKLIYLITTIYALKLMVYFEYIKFEKQLYEIQDYISGFTKKKFVVLNFCQKLCYFLTLSSLVYKYSYFFWIFHGFCFVLNLKYNQFDNMRSLYSTSLQINYYPSQYHLKYPNLYNEQYIFSSFYQSICLAILFLADIFISDSEKQIYRVVQTITFLMLLQEIFLSFKNLILYINYGPFQIEKQLNIKNNNELTNFSKQLKDKTLTKKIILQLINDKKEINYTNELELLLKELLKRKNLQSKINFLFKINETRSDLLFKIKKVNLNLYIDFLNDFPPSTITILNKILDYDYDNEQIQFFIQLCEKKQKKILQSKILNQLRYYYPRKIRINNKEPMIFIQLQSIIMMKMAFYKYIVEFIPLNHCAVIYDLFE